MSQRVLDFQGAQLCKIETFLFSELINYVHTRFSEKAIELAWDEFHGFSEEALELPFESLWASPGFLPWFLFCWISDAQYPQYADMRLPKEPIGILFLKECGPELSTYERAYLVSNVYKEYSFYQVKKHLPEHQILVRDLLLNREFSVKLPTTVLLPMMKSVVFARAVCFERNHIFVGNMPIAFTKNYTKLIGQFKKRLLCGRKRLSDLDLLKHNFEIRECYYQLLKADPVNTDQKTLSALSLGTDNNTPVDCKAHYELLCSPADAFERLITLSGEKAHWSDYAQSSANQGESVVRFSWAQSKHVPLGEITLQGDKLWVRVNSRERLESVQNKIKRRLGKLALFKCTVFEFNSTR